MSFFGRCCFFDVASVVAVVPGVGTRFNALLPGYLGDLFATHGSLVGLAFEDWAANLPNGVGALQDTLYRSFGMSPLRIHLLDEEDPMASVLEVRRRMCLDFSQCSIYLSPATDTRMEGFAKEMGIGHLRMFDPSLLQ